MKEFFQKPLAEATAQEIQLELIRRSSFNEFDGEKVAASLLAHRDLWDAVVMDRLGLLSEERLPSMALIKLRDLPSNFWNVDTLFILARNEANARELARIAEDEEWAADEVQVHTDSHEVGGTLGQYGHDLNPAIVSVWWD